MPTNGRRAAPGRGVPTLVVLVALVVALGAVAASTTLLLRPAQTAAEWARDRDAPTVEPQRPVDRPAGLHLLLVPHPDDELSGWTSMVEATDLRPLLFVATRGESTRRCDAEVVANRLEADLGEVAPDPRLSDSMQACGAARVHALREALAEAARPYPRGGDGGRTDPDPAGGGPRGRGDGRRARDARGRGPG